MTVFSPETKGILDGREIKPRMLFVRHKRSKEEADFQEDIENGLPLSLGRYFDVHIIERDFDFTQVCDEVQPDLVMFDVPGGIRSNALKVTNIGGRRDVPRIGFQFQDPHDASRVGFIKFLESVETERIFAYGLSTHRQSPEIAERVYSVPLHVNEDVFRDYGHEKIIPISVFGWGTADNFYNWRRDIVQKLIPNFPTFVYTHPGYEKKIPAHRFPVKNLAYAEILNRSFFSLSDCTRGGYLVRKHLEIPASGSVLVSPYFKELDYYGFRDLENCILGEGQELLAKIAYVTENRDLYELIRKAGFQLVHERYTHRSLSIVLNWYDCEMRRKPGQVVQQQGAFGSFINVAGPAAALNISAEDFANSDMSTALRFALSTITGNSGIDEAEATLKEMLNWHGQLMEPCLMLCIIALLKNDLDSAKEWALQPHSVRESRCGHSNFDPEELGWLWFIGMLRNDESGVQEAKSLSSKISHRTLRRFQAFESLLLDNSNSSLNIEDLDRRQTDDRPSIHWTGIISFEEWRNLVNRIILNVSKMYD